MPSTSMPTEAHAPCLNEPVASSSAWRADFAKIAPGVVLTAGVASTAFLAHKVPGLAALSPLILAIVLGAAAHNIFGTPAWAKAGVTFALRPILRLGIILLGLQLTAAQVVEVGANGLAIIAATLIATFAFTTWLGRMMGVERKLTQHIAACVTIFGSLAMLSYPLLPSLLQLDAHGFGLWAGASIHEIAQVVAAAFQDGTAAGEFGTIAKLSRVMLLAPVVISLGLLAARQGGSTSQPAKKAPIPWFVLGFIGLIAVNSVITIPAEAKGWTAGITTFLLSMSLAAMGLETDIAKLRAKGGRLLLLGAAASLFIATFSLGLIKLMG